MGSAKTALLLTTAYNFEERKMSYMCMKPVIDTRDHENVIASRIGIRRECQWIFHDTDLYVDDFGSNVICYGLRTDFQSHLFEGSRRLFEIADTIDEIKSTCNCGRKTIINARIDGNGDFVEEGEQVEIGGDDRYVAVCRKCWRNKRIEQASRVALPLFEESTAEDADVHGGVQ